MREYGKIYTTFWTSPEMQGVSEQARLLAAYLLTGPHGNMLGCFRLPMAYIQADMRWVPADALSILTELITIDFVRYDKGTSWLFLPNYLTWNPIENPNQGKAAAKLVEAVPVKSSFYAELIEALKPFAQRFPQGLPEPSPQGLAKPSKKGLANQEQEQEQQQEQQPEQQQDVCAASSAPPPAPVITLTLNDGTEFPITKAQAEEFSRLYPAVEILQSLRAMRGWLNSNPTNRKTKRGILAFVNRWLARDQDDAPKRAEANPGASVGASRTRAPERKPQPALPANLNASTGKLALLKILEAAKKGGVDKHSFEMWFQPLRSLGIADGVLYIGTPSDDFEYVGQRYGEMINGVVAPMGLTAVRYVTQGE